MSLADAFPLPAGCGTGNRFASIGGGLARLQKLPGIGPWSARYALLRGLGRLEIFPAGDVGAAHTMGKLVGASAMTPREAQAFAEQWKDYAGLLYFHLLGSRFTEEAREIAWTAGAPAAGSPSGGRDAKEGRRDLLNG